MIRGIAPKLDDKLLCRSWIPASMPGWAEVDLGGVYKIHEIVFGSENKSHFADRAAIDFEIWL